MPTGYLATPTTELFERLERDLGFTQHELAVALGTTTKMVERWQNGVVAPSQLAADRLKQLDYLHGRLYHVFKPHDVLFWLRESNEHLNWLSPAAAIVAGQCEWVDQAIDKIGYRLVR